MFYLENNCNLKLNRTIYCVTNDMTNFDQLKKRKSFY